MSPQVMSCFFFHRRIYSLWHKLAIYYDQATNLYFLLYTKITDGSGYKIQYKRKKMVQGTRKYRRNGRRIVDTESHFR